jgi:hypothetical protein
MRQKCAESNPKFNLLVLDDVLTSVDAPHRQRVATYILQKAATEGTQIIITTHSRQWYEWLLHIQATLGLRDKFVNKQILSWSLEEGPVIQDPEDDYEYLVRQLNNIDIHLLVPIAGRLLESILQQLRYSLQLAIPAKPDERYTLGDLFPKFKSDCGKKHKTLWNSIKELCDNLSNTWGIRNWDTHANEWAKDLSQEECKQFVEPVIELYKFIFCSSCRSFIHLGNIPAGIISCKKGCLCYQPNNQQENANISIT